MAVVIETTLGDLTVDLFLDRRPQTCLNFLKLCKLKYYNYNLFHTIQSNFLAQTGDPTGEGSGGMSVWGILDGPQKRFFSGEKMPKIRHTDIGLLSMVGTGDMIGSQFFFTLGENLDSLDGSHCVIGIVTEGHEVLRKLNEVICDEAHRPYQDVRITHTVVLEDPFDDPKGLVVPSRSPSPSAERLAGGRLAPDEEIDESKGKSAAELQELIAEREAKARATILEIVGDLPDADVAPPENVLFVCKLNPVTTDDDLELIFSRFGTINCCEVIRDKKTGNSLQYAFIEFAEQKSCEDAYFKMDNVLIDDRRIHVDFSQSVSKVKWLGKGRGVKHINDNSNINQAYESSKRRKSGSKEKDRESHKEMSHYRGRSKKDQHKSDHKSSRDHEQHKHRQKEKDHKDKHSDMNSSYSETKHSKSSKKNEVEESHSERHEKESRKRFRHDERDNSPERSRHKKYDESGKVTIQHKNDRKYEENEKPSEKKHKHQNKDKSIEESKRNKYDESEKNSMQHKKVTNKKKYHDKDDIHETDLRQKKRLGDDSDASNSDKNKYGDTSRREMKEDRGKSSNQSKSSDRRKRSYDSYAEKAGRYFQDKNNHENGRTSRDKENMLDVSSSSSRKYEKNPKKPIVIEDKYKLKGKRLQTPRTPSPDLEKRMKDLKESKRSKKDAKNRSGKQHSKKRRRSPSSSDSSDSSSSTSSSSSDGRKKSNRKKRKYTSSSSSSTSSDSSSSSSSDSDSSSSSTSSSSSSPKRKKKTKKVTKVVKKYRK